jgi:hypothetical protein
MLGNKLLTSILKFLTQLCYVWNLTSMDHCTNPIFKLTFLNSWNDWWHLATLFIDTTILLPFGGNFGA